MRVMPKMLLEIYFLSMMLSYTGFCGCILLFNFYCVLLIYIPDPDNHICLHCKRYYRNSLTHQITECKCTQPLKDQIVSLISSYAIIER